MGDYGFIFLLLAFGALFFKVFTKFEFGYTSYNNISTEFLCTAAFVTCLGIGLYLAWFQPASPDYRDFIAPRVYVSHADRTHKKFAHGTHAKIARHKNNH